MTSPINIPTRGHSREPLRRENSSVLPSGSPPQQFCQFAPNSWSSAPASLMDHRFNRSRTNSAASSEEGGCPRSRGSGSFIETILEDLDLDLDEEIVPFNVETTIERIETIKTRSLTGEEQEKTTRTRTVRKVTSSSSQQYLRAQTMDSSSHPQQQTRRSSIPVLTKRASVQMAERSTHPGIGRPGQTPRKEPPERSTPPGFGRSGQTPRREPPAVPRVIIPIDLSKES